mgnify:CR=1 FL=1
MKDVLQRSPRIERLTWGRIRLDDGSAYKDAKLFPGGSSAWDWNETGTRHSTGIQPADVGELLDHGADVVVLSKGVYERLRVCPETLQTLDEHGVDVSVEQTETAVERYNQLVDQGRAVGALIHSTC